MSKITIVPHTQGALGYTLHLPEEDKHLHTRDELLAQITVSMGGRVAEGRSTMATSRCAAATRASAWHGCSAD